MRIATCNHGTSRRFRRKLKAAVSQVKERLIARYESVSSGRVRAALAVAETQAWETPFPHLFFPDLAEAHLATVIAQDELMPNRRA